MSTVVMYIYIIFREGIKQLPWWLSMHVTLFLYDFYAITSKIRYHKICSQSMGSTWTYFQGYYKAKKNEYE